MDEALVVWAIVGFLFWIPMLFFAISRFSASVAYATIADVDAGVVAVKLEHAIRFNVEGFRNVVKALYRKPSVAPINPALNTIDHARVVQHVFGSVASWAFLFLIMTLYSSVGKMAFWVSVGIASFSLFGFLVASCFGHRHPTILAIPISAVEKEQKGLGSLQALSTAGPPLPDANRPNAVTFKGMGVSLAGPQLKVGDKAPDFTCLKGLETVSLSQTPAKARLFSVVPSLDTGLCSAQTKKVTVHGCAAALSAPSLAR